MKSAGIGSADSRRLRVLRDIAELPIAFLALAVNKDEISKTSGLIYKEPFLKFLHGRVYQHLYQTISSVAVVSDQHGDETFMNGFRAYVRKRHIRNLFNYQTFEFRDSKSDPLLQVADVISGSLGRHFDSEKASDCSAEFLEVLRPITAAILEWPPRYRPPDRNYSPPSDDAAVANVALEQAARFLEDHEGEVGDELRAQCCLVQYLLYELQFGRRSGYVSTNELREVLENEHGIPVSEHKLRSSIIAPLRDAGLLIASSQRGYKIPISVSEILDFVDHASSIVHPLLSRVEQARARVLMASAGKTDILTGERYERVRQLLGASSFCARS